jgi:hypothetical protein
VVAGAARQHDSLTDNKEIQLQQQQQQPRPRGVPEGPGAQQAAPAQSGGPATRAAAVVAAAAVTLASLLGPVSLPPPLAPAAAEARARLTPEEQLTVDVFKRNVPSVVNVTNLAVRWGAPFPPPPP